MEFSTPLLARRFEVQVLMASRCTSMCTYLAVILQRLGFLPLKIQQKTNFEVLKIKLVKINFK